jgi:hypothetical protein
MLSENESFGVCDIFDDAPASGDSLKLRSFRKNMIRFFDDISFLTIYAKSSRDLTSAEVSTNCRLFHIDGGHDTNNVYLDLILAESCLHAQGAIIMDDAYQPAWPGVMDGIYRFMHERPNRLAPLIYGFKKLVLVRPEAIGIYSDGMANAKALMGRVADKGPYLYKSEEIMGYSMHTYYEPMPVQAAFCPELVTAVSKKLPWVRNPITRWLNKSLRKLRGR